MRKRTLGGMLAAVLALSAFAASAAQVEVDADPLQVGRSDAGALECDPDGVNVTVNYGDQEPTPPDGGSQSATVSGIHGDCFGSFLTVLVLDGAENELGRATAANVQAGTVTTPNWTDESGNSVVPVDAGAVEFVEVHING